MNSGVIELFVRRLAGFVLVLFVLSLMIFVLARVVPGDPARIALGPSATQAQVDELRIGMGLDEPILTQYASYLGKVLRGDLGMSLVSGKPVAQDIASFLPATLELVLVTIVLIFAISVPLGVIAARRRNSWIDNVGRFFSLIGVTIPGFLFAIVLQLLAANYIPGWPILGRYEFSLGVTHGPTGLLLLDSLLNGRFDLFVDALRHIAFPALALAMAGIGQITRITRSAMIENQRKDHVLTLQSFGVPSRIIVFRYLFKLSSIAPLTILGLEFASLIGNAFVVEMVFAWGGFASYGLQAILQKDLNSVMAVVLVSGCFFVIANLVIDIIVTMIDPRVRFKEQR